jgi:hypothetical protein
LRFKQTVFSITFLSLFFFYFCFFSVIMTTTASPPSSHGTPSVHVVSARTTNNPYAMINLYCTKVKTREHSQFVGILSFALFIVLTVASFMVFEADAIFYIVFGIFIYAFLTESLFRSPRPCGILLYLVFETLQIGFYIATIIFILVDLTFSPYDYYDCTTTTTSMSTTPSTSTIHTTTLTSTTGASAATTTDLTAKTTPKPLSTTTYYCPEQYTTLEALMLLLVYSLLMAIKIYFIKIFTQYYKFISYQEQHSNDLRAQYVNGRGVNIRFPFPDRVYDNPVVNDPEYGYNLHPNTSPLPDLPSYHQAMSTQKPSSPSPTTLIAPPQYSNENDRPTSSSTSQPNTN